MAEYELYLSSAAGERIAGPLTQLQRLEWGMGLNEVGAARAEFSRAGIDPLWLAPGVRLEVWRSMPVGPLRLLQVYFLLDWGESQRASLSGDQELAWMRGYDLNDLLSRRIIAAASGSAGALKTGAAAVIMAEYVDEALLTDVGRDISGEFALGIAYDAADAGATITYAAARGQLLRVLQNCAHASATLEQKVRFWIEPISAAAGTLRIRTTPFGTDRRAALPFSPESGTLYDAAWERRGGATANYGYAGGRGEGADRVIGEASYGAMTALTRRELWCENTQLATEASLEDFARAKLWQARARDVFSGSLRDTERSAFGQEWCLGDLVSAEYHGRIWEAEVMAVSGVLSERGDEVTAVLNAETPPEVTEILGGS